LQMRRKRLTLEELSHAIEADELKFHYQPKISLVTGRLDGAEALLRWNHPDGSVHLPDSFIPVAESTGFITRITRHMFAKLLADMAIIHALDEALRLSFNASPKDFKSRELVDDILRAIHTGAVNPARLQIELTEASVLRSTADVRNNLQTLVRDGVSLAMDDYGKGFSSIDTLSRWPFSVIKIDKDIIERVQGSSKGMTIVKASVRMAHELNVEVVAEGVDSAELYEFLLRCGCTRAQGYWIGRPMPLEEFIAFIQADHRWSGLPVGLLHMAQLDHIHWRKALIESVTAVAFPRSGQDRETALEGVPALDCHECRLGEWYYGSGQEYAGTLAFDALEEPHRRLHQIGRELLREATNGASQEQLVTLMRRLTEYSIQVLSGLQELEDVALLELKQVGNWVISALHVQD
jgi:EAL domain-containing protein (putative c-di-GMP-specific phosphodiesterase class I)